MGIAGPGVDRFNCIQELTKDSLGNYMLTPGKDIAK